MTRLSLGALLLLALPTPIQAQRNCKKGIPCGGSCISASKTCRAGSSEPVTLRADDRSDTQKAKQSLAAIEARFAQPTATASLTLIRYVADVSGKYYYPITCIWASDIPPESRVFFVASAAAESMRFARAPIKKCL